MTRKNALVFSVIIAVMVLVVGGIYFLRPSSTPTDTGCGTARELVKYSDDKMADIAKVIKENDEGVTNDRYEHQDTTPMYREWADNIRIYADKISDTETKSIASKVADKADALAKVYEKYSAPVPDDQLEQSAIEKADVVTRAWKDYKASESELRNKCHIESSDPKV